MLAVEGRWTRVVPRKYKSTRLSKSISHVNDKNEQRDLSFHTNDEKDMTPFGQKRMQGVWINQ